MKNDNTTHDTKRRRRRRPDYVQIVLRHRRPAQFPVGCRTVHGVKRNVELQQMAQMFPAFVALRDNRVVVYAAAPIFRQLNHAVAETTEDMQNLLAGAAKITGQPLPFLLPTRQSELFRWCLKQKLRVKKPMALMAMGDNKAPRGCFLQSVLY